MTTETSTKTAAPQDARPHWEDRYGYDKTAGAQVHARVDLTDIHPAVLHAVADTLDALRTYGQHNVQVDTSPYGNELIIWTPPRA